MFVLRSRAKNLVKFVLIFLLFLIIMCALVFTKPQIEGLIANHINTRRFAREAIECQGVRFSSITLPTTAIASYPGSGNTWFRHILQRSTGIATGSVYMDKSLLTHGFPGERVTNGSVVGIKTHYMYNPHPNSKVSFDRAIILMRNPYEALVSCFKYMFSRRDKHTAHVNLDVFIKHWNRIHWSSVYYKFYLSWLQHPNAFLLFYDDLKHNLKETLVDLKDFLALPSSVNVDCGLVNTQGNFKRNHSTGMPISFYFSREQRMTINGIILDLKQNYTKKFQLKTHPFDSWLMDLNV